MYLNNLVKKKDEKFKGLVNYLSMILTQEQMQKVHQHFKQEWQWMSTDMPSIVMTEDDLIKLA